MIKSPGRLALQTAVIRASEFNDSALTRDCDATHTHTETRGATEVPQTPQAASGTSTARCAAS